MHIAFFNRSFYPDQSATGQLLTELAEDLVRVHACRVTVVTGPPLAASDERWRAAGWGLTSRQDHAGVTIVRTRGSRFDKRRFAGRAANYVSYFLAACWAALRLDRPDVVVALTDPPIVGLAGWLSARRFGARFVMSYRDLFPEVAALLEDFHSDAINAALQSINRFLCRRADHIVALGDTMRARLVEDKGARPERTSVIPDWADTTAIAPGPKRNAFSLEHGLADRFVVMHSGNVGLAQNLDTLVDAAALLRDIPEILVVVQGDGVRRSALEARTAALRLDNVRFLPYAPKDRLADSFASADLFVVALQSGLAGYIVPSKLYGILAAGRPYVAAVEEACEVAALTRARQCGVVIEPRDAPALANAIRGFFEDRQRTARAGERAREASATFDRAARVAEYMSLFERLAPRARVASETVRTLAEPEASSARSGE